MLRVQRPVAPTDASGQLVEGGFSSNSKSDTRGPPLSLSSQTIARAALFLPPRARNAIAVPHRICTNPSHHAAFSVPPLLRCRPPTPAPPPCSRYAHPAPALTPRARRAFAVHHRRHQSCPSPACRLHLSGDPPHLRCRDSFPSDRSLSLQLSPRVSSCPTFKVLDKMPHPVQSLVLTFLGHSFLQLS